MKTKSTHGGQRSNSGRKKKPPTGTASFRLDLRVLPEFKDKAKQLKIELESKL